MARNKIKEAEYKAEGLRRMKLRKEERNSEFRRLSAQCQKDNIPMNAIKHGNSWADSSSPTGYSQRCEMGGICESPCNGDC
jgi:hypothetical protein